MGNESVTLAVDAANLARNLFALVPVPLAVLDSNATIVLANAAFRGVFPTETSVRDVPHHDVEVDGERYDFELMPLQNGLSLFLGREVTEERRLRDRLENVERAAALGRMVPRVVRELREPLGHLAEETRRFPVSDAGWTLTAPEASGIAWEVERMNRVLDGLSDLSEDACVPRETIDFGATVREVIDAEDGTIPLECEIPDDLPSVLGVRAYLERVLSIILLNARDCAAGPKAAFELQVKVSDGFVRLDARLRSDTLPRPITSIRSSPAAAPDSGTGARSTTDARGIIGHGIATELVRKLGGKIDFDMDREFRVVLELPALPESEGLAARVRAIHGDGLIGKSIMVVDDEIVITALIEEFLTRCGARVEMFNSSYEAYGRLAANTRYDAIVCDQRMPGVSGESLYRRVEVLDPDQARRFVFVTGNALDKDARHFFSRTRTRYILKPFSLNDLYAAVCTAVEHGSEGARRGM